MSTAPKFARLRAVSLSVLKFAKGQPRFVYFIGPMHEGKKVDDKKEPATLIHSVDMETGEEGLVIAPMVLQNELRAAYPDDGYVGRGFEVCVTRDAEKKYNHVSICEVAVPEGFVPPPSQASLAASTTTTTAGAAATPTKASKAK